MDNPKLVWEKWENVYDSYEEDEIFEDQEIEEEEEEYQENKQQPILFLNPYDYDGTPEIDVTKLFNFWLCHCNFDIDHNCSDIIESCEGVETLEIITRYRFRISIGKVFTDREVMSNINERIINYINEKNIKQ